MKILFSRFPFVSESASNDDGDVTSESESEISDGFTDSEEENEEEEEDDTTDATQSTTSRSSTGTSSSVGSTVEDEYSSDEDVEDEEIDTSAIGGGVLGLDVFAVLMKNLQVLKQTRNLIVFIRNHRVTRDFLKQKAVTDHLTASLLLDIKSRWNSTHIMLERLLCHKVVVQAIVGSPEQFRSSLSRKQETKMKRLALSHDEWDLLELVYSILEPFRHATVLLSGQTYPTLSLTYYIMKGLENFLSSESEDNDLGNLIKRSIQAQFMHNRAKHFSTEQDKVTMVNHLIRSIDAQMLEIVKRSR